MPTATQYLPCPHCGSTNITPGLWSLDEGEVDAAECADCLAGAPLTAWNNRPKEFSVIAGKYDLACESDDNYMGRNIKYSSEQMTLPEAIHDYFINIRANGFTFIEHGDWLISLEHK